ncbi:hypothetical protein ABC347_13985 [Sphingomonas sp. 1P06PA]|uniref:hypothetical protein n=1 Tax=Sphingomonas sp. 1P06PA TaxID=554121 RepID=UPI0039A5DEA2
MKRARFLLALPAAALLASGCATLSPEAKVRDRLIEAGIGRRTAGCMAERMVDRLSIGQLRALGRVAKLPGRDVGRLSVRELIDRLDALGDPEIVTVVTRAGLGCAIAG